ncbi:MAG: tetratricopeptide repeat protein [Gammaproteobacteria bacterium]|nr:tetratricopeptide repeat protein [Gammaproteobacteria bacterium]
MKNIILDLESIQKLHRAGELDSAKNGYLMLLKKNPKSSEILHALGILEAQIGNFKKAIQYFENAVQQEPNNPIIYLNLANALKAIELFDKAIKALEQSIHLDPHYAAAYNNLGTIYYAQNNFASAIDYFKLAIENQPHYNEAYYNLGLSYIKQNLPDLAITTYQKLLELTPEHAAAEFQLARLLLEKNDFKAAEIILLNIEKNYPHHFETQTNLGTCYLKLGSLKSAKEHYLNALKLEPNDTQVLFNLGVICMQQGYVDSAIQYYQRALQIQPDYFSAHNNLGAAFLEKQHINFALNHFRAALLLEPDNEAIRYTVQMLEQDKQLTTSPPGYIKNLFDTYADHYDLHLLQSLDYKIPELLFNAFQKIKKATPHTLDILDLGCGTGLCGAPFKAYAKSLTGVDLSPNMLALATQKNIYDAVFTDDLLSYLNLKNNQYDLIIAGDVLVYIGDLEAIFKGIKSALRPGGLFICNTEINTKDDFAVNQSGRFSHKKEYLEALARAQHFKTLSYETIITRQQNNEPVHGHLFVWQT